MHLRMTGNLLLTDDGAEDPAHLRVTIDPGRRPPPAVRRRAPLRDRRRPARERRAGATTSTSRLGVEPLSADFTAEALRALARGRKQPVKAFLLNQERIAGVGNIYADEALFRARIHPLRPVGRLKRDQIEALRGCGGRVARARHRLQGRLDRRLPPRRRRARQLPGPLPRPHARGRAVPALRDADREAARRRAAGPTSARTASGGRASGGVRPRGHDDLRARRGDHRHVAVARVLGAPGPARAGRCAGRSRAAPPAARPSPGRRRGSGGCRRRTGSRCRCRACARRSARGGTRTGPG